MKRNWDTVAWVMYGELGMMQVMRVLSNSLQRGRGQLSILLKLGRKGDGECCSSGFRTR